MSVIQHNDHVITFYRRRCQIAETLAQFNWYYSRLLRCFEAIGVSRPCADYFHGNVMRAFEHVITFAVMRRRDRSDYHESNMARSAGLPAG